MAYVSFLIKQFISNLYITHCCKSVGGRDWGVQCQLFAIFLGNFNVRRVELTIAIRFQNAEQVTDNLLLPVQKFKFLSSPCAFGMAEAFNKGNCIICRFFIISGIFRHKACRFKSCHCSHLQTKKTCQSKSASLFSSPPGAICNRDSIPIVTMLPYNFKFIKS